MKRIFRLFTMIFLIAFTLDNLMAQSPSPPDPNGGANGFTPGTSICPIGDSILPLMIFVLMYVGMKLYNHHQLQKESS